MNSQSNNEGTKPISFRIDAATYKQLTDDAAARGLSVGALAKQRTLAGEVPKASEGEALGARIESVENHLVALRSDFLFSVEALLLAAGKLTKEQAKEWVMKHIAPH